VPLQLMLHHLSPGQGKRWLAYVEQSQPGHLTRLAQLMHASTGLVDDMDGSLHSLDPLFEWLVWFIEHDGLDLIDRSEQGPASIALGHERRTIDWTGEAIPWTPVEVLWAPVEAYVFEVARRIDSSAHWDSWPRPPRSRIVYTDDNRVGLVFRGEWKIIEAFVLSATPRRPGEDWTDPAQRPTRDKLRQDVATHIGVDPDLPQPRQESILTTLLERPVALPEIPLFTDTPIPRRTTRDTPRLDVDPVTFLHRSADPEELETAQPLDPGAVVDLLVSLGATTLEGQRVTRRRLLGDEEQFVIYDGAVLVETLVIRRKLRALVFEPREVSPAEWAHLLTRLDTASTKLGAHSLPTEGY
jgi:hypothetical protein